MCKDPAQLDECGRTALRSLHYRSRYCLDDYAQRAEQSAQFMSTLCTPATYRYYAYLVVYYMSLVRQYGTDTCISSFFRVSSLRSF